MATVTVADAKNHFSDLLRRAEYGGERVIRRATWEAGGRHRLD